MTEITIKASKKAVEEAATSGDFEDAPDGYYVCELMRVDQRKGKESGNEYLAPAWKPIGEGRSCDQLEKSYSWLWDTVMLEGDDSEWKRAEFLLAVGQTPGPRAASMKIKIGEKDPGTVIGSKALVRVGSEQYNNARKAVIKKVLPWSENDDDTEGATESGNEDEVDPTTDLDETFGDDEGTTEAPAEDDYVPWTKEALLAEGKDKVKEVMAEFDVKPPKGASMGDVINLVLEAQEAWLASQSEGGDVDPEDEPF